MFKLFLNGSLSLWNESNIGVYRVYINWYDNTGTMIFSDYDNLSTSARNYSMDLEAGTYYISINKYNSNTGTYSFTPTFTPANNTETEPNNAVPTEAQSITSGEVVKGFISHLDDLDLYKFVLTQAGRVSLNITKEGEFGINEVYVNWYDNTGVTIRTKDVYYFPNDDYMDLDAGTYYIMISKYSNYTGTYFLKLDFPPNSLSEPFYKISYSANAGSGAPSSQIKVPGTALTISNTRPTRNSYSFTGWATTSNAVSAQYQPGDFYTESADVTLYAVWTPLPTYTITYNANWGLGAPPSQTKTHGTPLTLSSTIPTRTNYNFLGWASSQTSVVEEYYPGNSFTADESVTLYAVWQERKPSYTITYDANSGIEAPPPQSKPHGTTINLSHHRPYRPGYSFLGWAKTNTATAVQYAPGVFYNIDADRTLYTVWNIPTFNITTISSEGGIISGGGTFAEGSSVTLTALPDAGYAFEGWFDNGVRVSILSSYTFTVTENRRLEARFATMGIDPNLTINSVIMTRNSQNYNLLTQSQSFEHKSSEKVTIKVAADWGSSSAERVLLTQGGNNYLESASGIFNNIEVAKTFAPGKPIYVIAINNSGKISEPQDLKLYINYTKTSLDWFPSDGKISIFDKISFLAPSSVPVLSNQSFSVGMGTIDADIEIEGNEFKIAIGVKIFEKDADGKFQKAKWKTFKDIQKNAKEEIRKGTSAYKYLKNIAAPGTHLTIQSGREADVKIGGYIEGRIVNNAPVIDEGELILAGEMKYIHRGQTIVVVLPVYYDISAGGALQVSLGLKDILPDEYVKNMFTGNVKLSPFFEIGGGVGVQYIAKAGATGKATLNIDVSLDRNYQKVDLSGNAKFVVKAFGITLYSLTIAQGNWVIHETGNSAAFNNYSLQSYDAYSGIDFNSPVTFEDRSYINKPTTWLGDRMLRFSSFSDADADEDEDVKVLETNTYPDAMPKISTIGDSRMMIWTADDTDRSSANKSMLVYSLYNIANSTWSVPKPIMDNGTADFYPTIKSNFVAWQKATKEFDDTVTIAEICENSDIYVARWNENSSGFETPIRITNSASLTAQPQLAVNGTKATVVWTTNSENNILGITGRNSIIKSVFDGITWSVPETVISDLNTITTINAEYDGDDLFITYTIDEDNDLNTIEDREIYLVSSGAESRITDNSVLDSNAQLVKIGNNVSLFWYNDGNIAYRPNVSNTASKIVFEESKAGLTDDFRNCSEIS